MSDYLHAFLEVDRFRDYCPNGLQVEGKAEIQRIVTGVTASKALLEAAIGLGADAVLVHHGWFWKGEDGRVTGYRRQRLALALASNLNLLAYHLPLDAHPVVGNNAGIGDALGWTRLANFGDQDLGWLGLCGEEQTAGSIMSAVAARLGRPPQLIGDVERRVRKVAWCSGAAQGFFEQAIGAGADLYLSGEISEQTVHLAREAGVPYLSAGHHATERFGVQALGTHLAEQFGVDCRFVDIDNPV